MRGEYDTLMISPYTPPLLPCVVIDTYCLSHSPPYSDNSVSEVLEDDSIGSGKVSLANANNSAERILS